MSRIGVGIADVVVVVVEAKVYESRRCCPFFTTINRLLNNSCSIKRKGGQPLEECLRSRHRMKENVIFMEVALCAVSGRMGLC